MRNLLTNAQSFLKSALFAGAFVLYFAAPSFAYADNINVVFEATPLFSNTNIAPGDTVTRTVTVTNTSGASQDVYVKALNGVSTGSLGDKLLLTVSSGLSTPITNLPLSTLTSGTKEQIGTALPNGSTASYQFSVHFDSSAGNSYQNSTLSFDLCVGFVGASTDSCISDTSGGSGGGEGGGGGGGGSGGGSGGGGGGSGGGGTAFGSLSVGFQNNPGSGGAFTPNTTLPGIVLGASTGPQGGTLGFGNGTSHRGGKVGTGLATGVAIASSTNPNTDQLAAVGALGINLGAWPWWWWIPLLLLLIIWLYYWWYKRRKDEDTQNL